MSRYQVEVKSDTKEPLPDSADRNLRRVALWALERHGAAAGAELTIVLTDAEEIRRLNQQYRQIDAPTDVLSFSMDAPMPDGHDYLGDVVVCVEVAASQAREAGHNLLSELSLLVVHGVLHLLGYDHATADARKTMWAIQDEILAHFSITAQPTES